MQSAASETDPHNWSGWSNLARATTLAAGKTATCPAPWKGLNPPTSVRAYQPMQDELNREWNTLAASWGAPVGGETPTSYNYRYLEDNRNLDGTGKLDASNIGTWTGTAAKTLVSPPKWTGLEPDQYFVQVRSVHKDAPDGKPSDWVTSKSVDVVEEPTKAPPTPVDVTAVDVSTTAQVRVRMSWTDPVAAGRGVPDRHEFRFRDVRETTWQYPRGYRSVTTTATPDITSGRPAGSTGAYRRIRRDATYRVQVRASAYVRSVSTRLYSPWSKAAEVTIGDDPNKPPDKPPPVFGLVLTSTDVSVTARWQDQATGKADQYYVTISEGTVLVSDDTTSSPPYTFTSGIKSQTRYTVSVTAQNVNASSTVKVSADPVTASINTKKETEGPEPCKDFPPKPGAVRNPALSGATSTSLTFAWDAPSSLADEYQVGLDFITGGVAKGKATTGDRSHTFTALSPATEYRFGIIAVNVNVCNMKTFGTPSSVTGTTDDEEIIEPKGDDDDDPPPDRPPGKVNPQPTCSGETTGTIKVSWTAPKDKGKPPAITGYEVQKHLGTKVADPPEWSDAGTSGVTSRTVKSLSKGTSYLFRVRAKNAPGAWGDWSLPSRECKTLDDAVKKPGAVRNLKASTVTADSLTFTWDAPIVIGVFGAATSYDVFLRPSDGRGQNPTGRTAKFSGLAAATEYTVAVNAVNAGGSGPTTTLKATTAAKDVPVKITPGAPTGVTITDDGTGTSGTLGWRAPQTKGVPYLTGYQVQHAYGGSWRESDTRDVDSLAETVGYQWVGLRTDRTYKFRVRTTNGSAQSEWTELLGTFTPESITEPVTIRHRSTAPGNVTGTLSGQSVTVRWDKPSSDGKPPLKEYIVQLGNTLRQGVSWGEQRTVSKGRTVNVYTWTKLSRGAFYKFRVRASHPDWPERADGSTGSDWGEMPNSLDVVSLSKPSRIGQPSVSWYGLMASGLLIEWDQPGGNPTPNDYRIQLVYRDGGGPLTIGASQHVKDDYGTSLSYRWRTGLVRGRSYAFVVYAINSQGQSDASIPSQWVTLADAPRKPGPPSHVTASLDPPSQIEVNWGQASDAGVPANLLKYQVEIAQVRSGGTVGSFGYQQETASRSFTFSSFRHGSPLAIGSTYRFRVRAVNPTGESAWKGSISAVSFSKSPVVRVSALTFARIGTPYIEGAEYALLFAVEWDDRGLPLRPDLEVEWASGTGPYGQHGARAKTALTNRAFNINIAQGTLSREFLAGGGAVSITRLAGPLANLTSPILRALTPSRGLLQPTYAWVLTGWSKSAGSLTTYGVVGLNEKIRVRARLSGGTGGAGAWSSPATATSPATD